MSMRSLKRKVKQKHGAIRVKVVQPQPWTIERYYDDLTRRHSAGMALCMYYYFGIKMHDLFGFGAKRLTRLFNAVDEAMSGFSTGDFDADTLTQELYEKTGIDYRG